MIQSFSSGVLFFTLLPKLFLNFPKQYRNVFLLMVIVGLFGSNALGGLSGSLSLELDRWHWIFVVNIISAILCLILGNVILRKNEYHQTSDIHISRSMMITLVLSTISLMIPMSLLTQKRLPFIMGVADTLNCNIFYCKFYHYKSASYTSHCSLSYTIQ